MSSDGRSRKWLDIWIYALVSYVKVAVRCEKKHYLIIDVQSRGVARDQQEMWATLKTIKMTYLEVDFSRPNTLPSTNSRISNCHKFLT